MVTGGAGMIGSNLVQQLVNEDYEVYVADNLWRGKIRNLMDENGREIIDIENNFFNLDLSNTENCVAATKDMDVVYHLADVVAGINFVFSNQLFLWRQNTLINTHILEASIRNNVEKFIYVGSACSYPKSKQSYLNPPPFIEEDAYPAEPESAYGWSKLMGEYEVGLAQESGAISTSVLRLHNVYGSPCELDPNKSQVIPALCRKAILYPQEGFLVWGSGKQRRAFVYVDDVVNALLLTLKRGMNKGVIQIGPSESVSIKEIAEKIVAISAKDIGIEFDLSKPEGDIDRTANWNKARDILGWKPDTHIDDGLSKTYAWCLNQLTG